MLLVDFIWNDHMFQTVRHITYVLNSEANQGCSKQ